MASPEEVKLFIQVLVCLISTAVHVHSAPITITTETFKRCQKGEWLGIPADCCVPKIVAGSGPVTDFWPKKVLSTGPLRVRKALQCLAGEELGTYKNKLHKAYELMRALPDDDPRSLKMQNAIHCAYGTGSFLQDGSNNLTIDVHINWFFLPWHRAFVFFHERILQKLLDDPEFTLHFWNFDNGADHSLDVNSSNACFKAGHFIPALYSDPSTATFESNRSTRAFDSSRPVDLSFDTPKFSPSKGPPRFQRRRFEQVVHLNADIMHKTLFEDDTARFIGQPYRAGDARIEVMTAGAGTVEMHPHSSVHAYISGNMLAPQSAPSDPIFFPFHANVERLWAVWHSLSENHVDPTDPDWLDAQFLLWDENAALRRIKIRDFLTTEHLGYTYQKVNDESWISFLPDPDDVPFHS